jgi:sulfide dehydrogenase cytochrome subunit
MVVRSKVFASRHARFGLCHRSGGRSERAFQLQSDMIGDRPGLGPVRFRRAGVGGWRMKRLAPALGAAALLMAATAPVAAETPSATDAAMLAGGCMSCHGPQGVSPGAMPSIAGRPEQELATLLLAFHAGEIPGTTVMTRLMKGFAPEEIAALARYYAALPARSTP